MASPRVDALKAELQDQPHNPLRPQQVQAFQEELGRLGAIATGTDMEGHQNQPWMPGNRGLAARRRRELRQLLDAQAPKLVTGERANRIKRLTDEVIEEEIRPALLSKAEMWRNPSGAVGQWQRGENSPATKDAILTVKRGLRARDPMNDDPDFTSMERFRLEGTVPGQPSSFMVNATMPGHFAQSPQAKANWPLGEPTAQTALKQAQQAAAPDSSRIEQRRASLAKARAAKRAKAKAGQGAGATA